MVIEATGDPASGIKLCLEAIRHGKHIVMVNVEADALAGPLLARRAREAGVVYSLAWGDQPALIAEHVDWARACGFQVVVGRQGHALSPELSPVDAGHSVGHPHAVPADQGPQPHQSQDVQLVPRRHQVGHRDDGGVQRDGAGAADQRAVVPAGLAVRAGRRVQAQERGRHAGEEGRDGSGVLTVSRRQGRAASPRHGHLRGDREREPLRGAVLRRIQLLA